MTDSETELQQLLERAEDHRLVGEFVLAQSCLDAADALPATLAGADQLAVARGWLLQATGDFAGAEAAFRTAVSLEDRHDLSAGRCRSSVLARHALGRLYRLQGHYDAAEDQLRDALDQVLRHIGPDAPEATLVLNELGVTFKYSGKFDEASDLYQRALTLAEDRLGKDSTVAATIHHNLGGLAHARGDFVAAEPHARLAVEIRERACGPDHPAVTADRAALAPILDALGHHNEAEQLLRRALQSYLDDNDSYEVGVTLNNLGAIIFRRNEFAEARATFQQALAAKETTLGADHPELASTLNNLGTTSERLGDLLAAREAYERAIAVLQPTVEPTHPTLLRCRTKLAALGSTSGDPSP